MYSWIWRHLPFGLAGRIAGSLLLVAGVAALFWYSIFPNIEQYMPFTDGQVTGTDSETNPGADTVDPSSPAGPTPGLPGPDEIPYSTATNQPEPTKTR
jgi:hypothetical protein